MRKVTIKIEMSNELVTGRTEASVTCNWITDNYLFTGHESVRALVNPLIAEAETRFGDIIKEKKDG